MLSWPVPISINRKTKRCKLFCLERSSSHYRVYEKAKLENKMNTTETIKIVEVVSSVVLPLFNIPLILKIRKRGSSKDYFLTWTFGIFDCLLLIIPSVLLMPHIVFKVFGIINLVTFSTVILYILKYYHHKPV